jgi:two-component system, chemotaxis family, CheB/CheR fusion protein
MSEPGTPQLPLTKDQQLRAVFEYAGVGIAVTALDGRFVEVNHRFCEILGYSADELRGLTFIDVTYPDDADATSTSMRDLIEGRIAGYKLEKRYVRADKRAVWCDVSVTALRREDGTVAQFIGAIEDISARKQAEEARDLLAAAVQHSDDAIITKTLDGMITTWNPGAEQIFGYPAREAVGSPILIIVPPEHEHEEAAILARLRAGERVSHYETLRRRKDATLVNVSLSVSALKDELGHVTGASMIARDITQQKLAQLEIKAQAEALREMDRRKDEFLAILSHELRNPLAPIRQAAAISATSKASDDQRRWATEVIRRQVQTMSLLLDDLLDVSRITRGTLQLRATETNLLEVIKAAIETARPLIDTRGHRFEVQSPRDAVLFQADPLRLAQVLSNLLTNAAKYTHSGGSIRLVAEANPRSIVMRVEDNGIGIDPAVLPHIFTMFSQGPDVQEHAEGGLGIGLALAKGLVELHGGSIDARSAGLGCGSTFTVTLPNRPVGATVALAETSSTSAPQKRRVLVADDNRDAADSLAMLLRMEGHDVRVVYDGVKAIEAIRENPPEIALLDIGMPEMNGYDVARTVRKLFPKGRLRLIAVTGWGQKHDVTRAMDAGFDSHFTKPIDPLSLAALLSTAAQA